MGKANLWQEQHKKNMFCFHIPSNQIIYSKEFRQLSKAINYKLRCDAQSIHGICGL